MILVEGTDRVHYNAGAKVKEWSKFEIQRSKFYIDLFSSILEFDLGKEFQPCGDLL